MIVFLYQIPIICDKVLLLYNKKSNIIVYYTNKTNKIIKINI